MFPMFNTSIQEHHCFPHIHKRDDTLKDSPGAKGKKERVFSAGPHFPSRRALRWTALSMKLTFNCSPTSASVSSSWGMLDRVTSMLLEHTATISDGKIERRQLFLKTILRFKGVFFDKCEVWLDKSSKGNYDEISH